MNIFENCLNLSSVKCMLLLGDFPKSTNGSTNCFTPEQRYDDWDKRIVSLYTMVKLEEDHPLLLPTLKRNLARYAIWYKFRNNPVLRVTDAKLDNKGVRGTSVEGTLIEMESVAPRTESLEWPSIIKEVMWLIENVVLGVLNSHRAKLKDLSYVSLAIGRTIIMLGNCVDKKIIRRDQAKKLLEKSMQTEYIAVDFLDLIWRNEFVDIVDESEVDDTTIAVIDAVIAANTKAVVEFKSGKERALGVVVGQVMKRVKADPRIVCEMIITRINQWSYT